MNMFGPVDWSAVFVPKTPVLEILVRGTFVYLSLFVLLRLILKRQAGTVGVSDLLLVVLIADASQNAMAGEYRSVPDGILLVMTLMFWDYALDWLGNKFPSLGRRIHPPPLPIVADGKLIRVNLKRELISVEEFMSHMREQGIEDLAKVKHAYVEGDGRISIIPFDGEPHSMEQRPAT